MIHDGGIISTIFTVSLIDICNLLVHLLIFYSNFGDALQYSLQHEVELVDT